MVKKGQMLKQRGFVRHWHKQLQPSLQHITEEQLDLLVTSFWETLTTQLSEDQRIIFEHWITFYTKPVKRKCFNIHTKEEWITHKKRVRTNVLDRFRERSESDLND